MKIGRLFGTNIYLDPLWFLVLGLVVLPHVIAGDLTRATLATGFIVVLYLSVIAHEFAHIFAGRRFGIDTKKIIISFFGGVAAMDRIPFGLPETMIGLVGPAFSAILGAIITLPILLSGMDYSQGLTAIIWGVGYINLMLAFFNMLPIFPMDGGRILRGLLFHFNRKIVLSTKIVMITAFITIPFAFVYLPPMNPLTIIIMAMIAMGCWSEYKRVRVKYKDAEAGQ